MKARPQGWRSTATTLISLALCTAPSLVLADGGGNPEETYRFDIEAGEAAFRLNEFSTQSGFQVLFPFADMKGIPITPVHGEMKPFDALKKMIAGTDIRYQYSKGKSITVTLTVATADHARQGPRGVRANEVSRSRENDRRAPDPDTEKQIVRISSKHPSPLAEIGSSLFTLSRPDIDSMGLATIQGVVGTLPQIFGGGPTEDTKQNGFEARTNTARGYGINLRGLGASSTLVLMNGRRLAGGGSEGLFVDVSNLPLIAVERMDILPDSSSTFYGADAVGGVVNFVMRDQFSGAQTQAYHAAATSGKLNEDYVSQLFGGHTDSSRGVVAFDYYSRDNLAAASRSQARSDLTAFGGSDFDVMLSNPGTIVSGASSWAIPRGQDGTSLQPSDFQLGTQNLSNRYAGSDILPAQQRWSLFGTGRTEINDRVTLFGDLLFGQRNVHDIGAAQSLPLRVPNTNPYYVNPSGQPGAVTVMYSFADDLGPLVTDVKVRTADAITGFDLNLEADWTLTGTAGYASEHLRSGTVNAVNNTALALALASSDPASAFNPFGDGSFTPPEVIESIRAQTKFASTSSLKSGGLILSGPLTSMWGGDVRLAVGADARWQAFESETQSTFATSPVKTERDRSIQSSFIELQVPLIGPAQRFRFAQSLKLSLAERYERYSDFGDTLAARIGLAWKPGQALTLRSTYSQSFRPPGLLDLDENTNAYGFVPLRDPTTGGFSNVMIWAGKNRDLHEETASSWTAGLEFEPPGLSGIGLAMTYFDTNFTERLSQPTLSADLLTNPALAGLITRDPSAEYRADVCSRAPIAGSTGDCLTTPITAIADLRTRNSTYVRTRGVDVLGRLTRDSRFGQFSFGVNGTYIFEFTESSGPGLASFDRVSTPYYPVDLRLRGTAGWARGGLSLTASANFLNHYQDTLSTPERRVGSWTTIGLHGSYTLGADRGFLGDTTLSLGVENLLNENPPFLNNSGTGQNIGIGYDQENGDLTGRVVSFTVRKKW
jgi:outer membrane receptor protein involved in Fe transport